MEHHVTNRTVQRARKNKRGAAMVEAAFLALIFALIWNLCIYISGVYMAKIESAYISRYATLYFAEHNCDTGVNIPTYQKSTFNGASSNGGKQTGEEGNNQVDDPSSSSIQGASTPTDMGQKKEGFFAKGKGTASWTYVWNNQSPRWNGYFNTALSGTSNVHSDSYVMCNEPKYGANAAKFFWNFVKDGFSTIKNFVSF
jgi:Flp pilus assembly protein TadG